MLYAAPRKHGNFSHLHRMGIHEKNTLIKLALKEQLPVTKCRREKHHGEIKNDTSVESVTRHI